MTQERIQKPKQTPKPKPKPASGLSTPSGKRQLPY